MIGFSMVKKVKFKDYVFTIRIGISLSDLLTLFCVLNDLFRPVRSCATFEYLKLFVVIIRAINRQKARYLWLLASKWQSTVQVDLFQ